MKGVHLVLRTPQIVRARGKAFDLLSEHNAVVETRGRVLVCKFGLPLSDRIIASIQREIEDQRSPRMIIVTKQNGAFSGYEGPIVGFERAPFAAHIQALLPAYYDPDELVTHPNGTNPVGVLVSRQFKPVDLGHFTLLSNGRPLLDVIQECRTATMLVTV